MKRRLFLNVGLASIAAMVFPEVAATLKQRLEAEEDAEEVPWQWQPRKARAATDDERAKYLPLFEEDLEQIESSYGTRPEGQPLSISVAEGVNSVVVACGVALGTERIYARHVELAPEGSVTRTATTTFNVSNDAKAMTLHSMGQNADSAVTSRANFDARNARCAPPKKSCRACSEHNSGAILTCCVSCGWAGNPIGILSCAIVMCSLCASQNCLRWTYACCGV